MQAARGLDLLMKSDVFIATAATVLKLPFFSIVLNRITGAYIFFIGHTDTLISDFREKNQSISK